MKYVFVAFPGCGKTSLVKQMNKGVADEARRWVDLDIKGPKGSSARLSRLRIAMAQLATTYLSLGCNVCVHNLGEGFFSIPKDAAHIVFVKPMKSEKDEWLNRLKARGDSEEFIAEVDRNWDNWLLDYDRITLQLQAKGWKVSGYLLSSNACLRDIYARLIMGPAVDND